MAWYYVKNGGTATGDAGRYGTQQTGSFAGLGAAGYYNDLVAAFAATTAPTTGDFILVSDLHNFTYAGAASITGTSPGNFIIMCVDDANIDAYRTSGNRGFESAASNQDYTLTDISMKGMEIAAGDDIFPVTNVVMGDCKLTLSGPNDSLSLFNDRRSLILNDSEVALDDASATINIQNGCVLYMYGGSVTTTSGGLTGLITGSISGGMQAEFWGVDLTSVTGTLINNVGGNVNDDTIDIRFDRCKLNASVAFTNEDFQFYGQRAEFIRCSSSDNGSEYAYHLTAFGGEVDDDTTVYRNDDVAFTDSAVKISYQIVTNTDVNVAEPLWFDFPISRRADLTSASTDTLRFFIASTDTLTDADIYINVLYPDGTTRSNVNQVSSAPSPSFTTVLDPLATPTTLTTDSGSDWRDGGGAYTGNEYLIDIDTSGDAGANCIPTVRVFVTKPSVTINIASEYDLV